MRLSRCNLDCAWCDTPYTWDWGGKNGVAYVPGDQQFKASPAELMARLQVMSVDGSNAGVLSPSLVVITGGEPMLQRHGLEELAGLLAWDGYDVEIETNGTIAPSVVLAARARFNVSPKLANSGIDQAKRLKLTVLDTYAALAAAGRAIFKFVVVGPADFDEIEPIIEAVSIPVESVWIMPEGRTVLEQAVTAKSVAEEAIRRGFNVSLRAHVQLWGDQRGH